MHYDKTQANTPVTLEEFDHLVLQLPFEMQFWEKQIAKKEDETVKDYRQRVLDKVVETSSDETIAKLHKDGRYGTLNLLANPDTPQKTLADLRKNLSDVLAKKSTSGQATINVLKDVNPAELKRIQQAAIREHLAQKRAEDARHKKALKMNVS